MSRLLSLIGLIGLVTLSITFLAIILSKMLGSKQVGRK